MKKYFRKYVYLPLKQLNIADKGIGEIFDFKSWDRLGILMAILIVMTVLIVVKLFVLQVADFNFYTAMASDQHEIQRILYANRGDILMADYSRPDDLFYAATNKQYFQIYSVPQQIDDPESVAEELYKYVNMDKERLVEIFSKEDDPYEPIEKKVGEERYEIIKELSLPGIYGLEETYRYYVDDNIGSNIVGFVGIQDDKPHGQYGIEGYFNDILAGQEGLIQSERDVAGRWIALSDRNIQQAVDGADIVLTIDRALQFKTCSLLNESVLRHGADGGAVIVLDPSTGKVLAMCSNPDFNPNYYSDVKSASAYNNKAIFESYEPGSIFKPVVMSAAMDMDYVTPDSTYVDTGSVTIDEYTIKNAGDKVYGEQNMAGVLENSINTGMIHVSRLLGQDRFKDYVERFGFGELTGIELQTEVAGNISSLEKRSEVYTATASFGQGITVTPMQIAVAYSTFANGGNLVKPYVIDEIRYADGSVEKRQPTIIRQVISPKTSILMTGMLTSVVMNGHASNAKVPGYYVAGKTGTAQIAGSGGSYLEDATNHSFVGYAPADDPRFVIMIRLERPRSAEYSASTAARVFGDLAKYILNYYEVPPDF